MMGLGLELQALLMGLALTHTHGYSFGKRLSDTNLAIVAFDGSKPQK